MGGRITPWAAAATLWLSALQLALCRRRDLGPFALGAGAAALISAPAPPEPFVAGAVGVAAVLSALAWARGARAGVARPGLCGAVLAAGVLAGVAPLFAGDAAEAVRAGGPVAVIVTGALAGVLALERPGPHRRPPRWFGRIRVEVE